MLKKGLITALLVAVGIFALGTAQAAIDSLNIDGLVNNQGGGLYQPDGVTIPTAPALPTNLGVSVNPGGIGDALIYGYYNARGNWNFIRVINTSDTTGIGAKVRFREGKNSNELLDFYICLSAGDQWTAFLIGDNNINHPAQLVWYDDDTPTFPDPGGVTENIATNNKFQSVPLRYSSTGAASSVTADMTKEGYFEIIANYGWPDVPGSSKLVKTPFECGKTVLNPAEWVCAPGSTACVFDSDPISTWPDAAHAADGIAGHRPVADTLVYDAPNALIGDSFIFNLVDGMGTYAFNAVAIHNFYQRGIMGSIGIDSTPTLANAQNAATGAEGTNYINYILTKRYQFAPYDVEADLIGATTIINTFPTKKLSARYLTAAGPFNNGLHYHCYECDNTQDGKLDTPADRCEIVGIGIWDDMENNPLSKKCDFSPCRPETKEYKKCDEVSLMVVGTSADPLLNSTMTNPTTGLGGLVQDPKIDVGTFQLGWIVEDFYTAAGITAAGRTTTIAWGAPGAGVSSTTHGLPVIGYEMQGFLDGYLTHMLPLQYATEIVSTRVTNAAVAGSKVE